jgi:putative salt-induced outer membrane protein YdiY
MTMPGRRLYPFASVLALANLLAGGAAADEIFLKNGDHITGKVVSADAGAIVFTPDFAKGVNLTIAAADVATLTTSAPVVVKFKDGTEVRRQIQQGPAGQIVVASGGPVAGQPVPVTEIDKINPPPVAWHGSVGVNGLYSRAATSSQQIGFTADGVRRTEKDRITLGLAYSYGSQSTAGDGATTNANNWLAQAKYDYFFTPKWYGYGNAEAAGDQVNFLRLRFTPGLGAGYQWIDSSTLHFNTEAGGTWLYEDYSTRARATEVFALRAAYRVDKSWDAGRIDVFHDLELIPSLQNGGQFLVNTEAGVRFALTKSMYSDIKANLTYDNRPAPGALQTTTTVRIGVGMSY